MSENKLASGEVTPSEDQKNHRQRQGRVNGRIDCVRRRFERFCHTDAVGRFTRSAVSFLFLFSEEMGDSYEQTQ